MSRPKYKLEIYGMIPDMWLHSFMRDIERYTDRNIGIQDGGGNVSRVIWGKARGVVKGPWFLINIQFEEMREQHVGAYTECEYPVEIELRTTIRNSWRARELMGKITRSIIKNGGYVSHQQEYKLLSR